MYERNAVTKLRLLYMIVKWLYNMLQAPRRHRVSLSMDGEDFCTYCEYSCVDWLEINDQAQFSTPGPRWADLGIGGLKVAAATLAFTTLKYLYIYKPWRPKVFSILNYHKCLTSFHLIWISM